MLWSLNTGHFWSVQVTWPSYWPQVGQYRSRVSIAGFWLVIPEVSVSSSEVTSSEAARPKVWTSLDTFIQWLPLGGSQRNSNDRSQELKLSFDNYYLHFFSKICVITKRHFMLSTMLTTKQSLRDWCCCESHREFYTSHPSTLEKRSRDQSQSSIPALDQSQPELGSASRASRGNRRSASIAR